MKAVICGPPAFEVYYYDGPYFKMTAEEREAYAAGIVNGMGNDTFSPETTTNRERSILPLYRFYAKTV